MPFEGEFAGYKPLQRLVQSERVKDMLSAFGIREASAVPTTQLPVVSAAALPPSDWQPDLVVAVDGSNLEVAVRNGFPGAEASYITVASVILDVEKMRELDRRRPANPHEFRTVQRAECIDCALPGSNVVYQNEASARDSLRRSLLEVMASGRVFSEGESLLETYEALLRYKPTNTREQRCPCEDCPNPALYMPRPGCYSCSCPAGFRLYSTDALRIHEGMNPVGSNGALFAEARQVLERVWVVHILRALEARGWLSTLRRLAIVLDGPLAVFGHPAWLSQAIRAELCRINERVRQVTGGRDILLLGVEKDGAFAKHLNALDQQESGSPGRLERQYLALPTDAYIKRYIQFSLSPKPYGLDTYFGRKFFYKTRTGALIVGNLPSLTDDQRDTQRAEPDQFPRLADAVRLLDDLFCCRYPNAVAPLVAAHAEAAIPLNLGKKVLEDLARQMMSDLRT